jgi:GxxExxY protein
MSALNILHREESYHIIGSCFEVYKEKGNGFLEAVYQECLAIEFTERDIPFQEKPKLQLHYKSHTLKQEYEPDFVCYGKIVVEIKAIKQLANEHRSQIINYLKSTDYSLGLLVNFGHYPKIEHERFLNERARND